MIDDKHILPIIQILFEVRTSFSIIDHLSAWSRIINSTAKCFSAMQYSCRFEPTRVNETFYDSENKQYLRGAHLQVSEQSGIVTKSKQIPEAMGRRACNLDFESMSDLDRMFEGWRDGDALLTLSLTLSG